MSCSRDKTTIQEQDLAALKQKYDARTVNYFYETVFHEDFGKGNNENLWKWTNDPTIVIKGRASAADTTFVREAIAEINTLGLPLKCRLAQTPDSGAIQIFFGNVKEVASFLGVGNLDVMGVDISSSFGFAKPESYEGRLINARIGIYFSPNDTTAALRKKVVLEEIVQALGIFGDSYSYPSSLFFQNSNPQKRFTDLDKNVLRLLYEPAILPDYSRLSFEMDFADSLYPVNSNEKLQKYLRNFPVNPQIAKDLDEIFSGDLLLKHPKEVNVFLFGAFSRQDSASIAEASSELSKLSPNLKIAIGQHHGSEPDHGVVISLTENKKQEPAVLQEGKTIAGKSCMYPKIIKNKISLSFNLSDRSKELRQQSLVSSLYFSLVPIKMTKSRIEQLYTLTNDRILFTRYYADLLRIVYANEFVDGYDRREFVKLKSSLDL
ncbi:DUF2927 domain-containing protein [Dyadobacter sp. CY261]|uniref:DUF2927 domain-containing protein n=1 Tax=Dyadobacter sp. CY261 TaxID=2907203 RepID=UPI001F1D8C2C|nr:DUF2927 domain-containing protein [Dyadobacter sp. CY261]MCF0069763.1 DUF2927 domain-containing protein [Dyadobacter sp. CY261]